MVNKQPGRVVAQRGNLNAARAQRAKAQAARRGETGEALPIIFGPGDPVIAELGPELPVDVFAPLLAIEVDLPALVVQLMEAANNKSQADGTVEALVGVLVTNPNLPVDLVEAAKAVGRNLLGDAGYEAFAAQRPSLQDIKTLCADLMDWYGVSLGEFWRSEASSSTDGGTSTPISATTTPASSPAESGGAPATPDSSASAA